MAALDTHQHIIILVKNTHLLTLPSFLHTLAHVRGNKHHAIKWMSPPATNHNQPYYHGQCRHVSDYKAACELAGAWHGAVDVLPKNWQVYFHLLCLLEKRL